MRGRSEAARTCCTGTAPRGRGCGAPGSRAAACTAKRDVGGERVGGRHQLRPLPGVRLDLLVERQWLLRAARVTIQLPDVLVRPAGSGVTSDMPVEVLARPGR